MENLSCQADGEKREKEDRTRKGRREERDGRRVEEKRREERREAGLK